uniref:Sushi domain-containing protein n=1 Tax=Scleropages formosus TaxID=113540 RepID=A0A8C9SV47_SCLFO
FYVQHLLYPELCVNLTETNKGFFPLSTVLRYGCDQSFAVDGPSIVHCTATGRWSSDPPRCVWTDVCWPPFTPKNGGYMCHLSPCHWLILGTVIEYFCDEGYDSPMQISCCPIAGQGQSQQLRCHPTHLVSAVQYLVRPVCHFCSGRGALIKSLWR